MRARLALGVCCLTMGVSGCGDTGGQQAAAMDHVTAVVLPFLSLAPFHIAAAEGYFAEQNLDVEFVRLGRDHEIMTSLARGEVDVASGMLTLNELSQAARGLGVRMVASLSNLVTDGCPYVAVVARSEHLESGALQDPERIRGLRFDTNVLTPHGYWMDEVLRPLGLTIDDLDVVDLPPPASVVALIDGSTDVSLPSEPQLSILMETGAVGIWERIDHIVPDYVFSTVKFGPGIIEQRREVGERFTVAIVKAIRQFNRGKTPRNLEIVEDFTGMSHEQALAACWAPIQDDGRIDASVFNGYQEWNVTHGLLDRVLAEDELFDHSFVDHAIAVLGG